MFFDFNSGFYDEKLISSCVFAFCAFHGFGIRMENKCLNIFLLFVLICGK